LWLISRSGRSAVDKKQDIACKAIYKWFWLRITVPLKATMGA